MSRPADQRSSFGYLERAESPLASLVVLLPLIVLYEIGTLWWVGGPTEHGEQRIIAFTLMQRFFALCGATGRYLPPLAVVFVLLSIHIAKRDPWRVSLRTCVGMVVEGGAWGVPLLAMGIVFTRYFAQHLPLAASNGLGSLLVLSIGAGIYEELVFRLAGMAALHFLLVNLLHIPQRLGLLYMVVISAVAFALYHYLGAESFGWRSFAFRTLAGVYFSLLLLRRGFGVTALSHTSYDILVVLLRFGAST